jgi:hypothetical protein
MKYNISNSFNYKILEILDNSKIISLTILFAFGVSFIFLPEMHITNINAQTYNKVISFPDVNVTDSKNINYSLDEEFILVNNQGNDSQNPLEILNPDFGLNPPFVNLAVGQKYTIDPPNQDDIQYSNVTVKLAQVLFIAPGIKVQDADPEDPDTMTLGGQTDIAHFGGGKGGSFDIPPNVTPGNYILYTYVQYPYGITGVFSNFVTIKG